MEGITVLLPDVGDVEATPGARRELCHRDEECGKFLGDVVVVFAE